MRLLPRHPATWLLAVTLACLVWYTQARERRERISERQLDTALTFVNVPGELVITSEVPRSVLLRVQGPLTRLRQLEPAQTGVVVDLRGAAEGQKDFALEERNVSVPAGVKVLAVSPTQIPVRLERFIRRRLAIRPQVVGAPAPGFVVGAVQAEPATVMVSGPRLQIESLQGVTTEPLNVDAAEGPVEGVLAVRSPNPLVRIDGPAAVRVTADMIVRRGEIKGGRGR